MSLHTLASHLQSAGRGEDKVLVHMTPGEVKGLQALAMSQGGSLTINPQTGLPEAGILSSLLPMVAGFFLGPAGLGLTAMQSAVAVGALGTAATGSLGKGFMMGLGAYGGAGLGAGLTSAGSSTLSNVPGEFGVNAGAGTGADYAKWMASDAGKAAATQTGTTTAQSVASNVAPGTGGFEALKPQGIFANPNVSAYGAAPTVAPPVATTPMPNASDVFREGLASPSEFVRPTPGASLQDKIMTGGAEKTGTFTAPEAKPLTYDQATPTWDASKPATTPSNWDKAKAGFDKATGSWEGAKEVWNATPTGTGYGLAATGMSVMQAQQEEAAAKAKAEADAMAAARRGHYRPYDFSTELNENAFAPRESTSEFAYYKEPRFIARPIEKIAKDGGLMSLAVGGQVEQMSAQNAVGNNQMYPQSQFHTPMYSNPMVQRPMPTNVIQSGIDAPVDPYTGEAKFASGGAAASKKEPSTETKYSYNPETMQYTQTTSAAPASGNFSGNPFIDGMVGLFGVGPYAMGGNKGIGMGGFNPNGLMSKLNAQASSQPATTTEVIGGTTAPYVPPSGLAAAPQQIVPNIPAPPQQNVDRQLGLESFYPMMEQQLALKGSNLQAQGYAEGGTVTGSGNLNLNVPLNFGGGSSSGTANVNGYSAMGSGTGGSTDSTSSTQLAPAAQAAPAPMAATQGRQYMPEIKWREGSILNGGMSGPLYTSGDPQADAWVKERQNSVLNMGQMDAVGQHKPEIENLYRQYYQGYANGGVIALAAGGMAEGGYNLGGYSDGGRLLKGPGDGVSDSIPASIGDRQPARLADGEFVVPARIVSEIGNGSTEAGARKLYAMMDRVQKARKKTVGKNKVAVNTKAEKLLPA